MAVVRERKLAAPALPKRLPAEPLPNAAPMSAPLPCWSSTSTTMPTAARMCNTRINVCIDCLSPGPGSAPDPHEFLSHQRCPADESAVDVRHREQFRRVRRLDAAAVQDRQPFGHARVL